MELTNEKISILKDGKRYLCTVELLDVKGGRQVLYVSESGAVIKQEPLFRYNERIKRRAASSPTHAIGILPAKERLIVQRLRDFIENDKEYTIALVAGIRKTGKTTALKQLQTSYPDARYVDFMRTGLNFDEILDKFMESSSGLLLLDEIAYLADYERFSQHLYDLSNSSYHRHKKFKIIITGSSLAHVIRLNSSKLGGGRARLFRLPPITFVEYLYITGKINSYNYNDYENVTTDDFADYLTLEGLTDLRIQFDDNYFRTFYDEVADGNKHSSLSHSLVELGQDDLLNMSRLLAYKLSEPKQYWNTVNPSDDAIGGQEKESLRSIGVKYTKGVDLSDALVTSGRDAVLQISPKDRGRILGFMLRAGLASVEYNQESAEKEQTPISRILHTLENCASNGPLEELFKDVSICLITPLFYSRLGIDILTRLDVDVAHLCKGALLGKMVEVYMRGIIALLSKNTVMTTVKLAYPEFGEVDVYDSNLGLLLEITISNKPGKGVNAHKYFKDEDLIRACSSRDRSDVINDVTHVPYAKLCCMLDTGDIFSKLPRVKGSDI